jgi:hypothetical protein
MTFLALTVTIVIEKIIGRLDEASSDYGLSHLDEVSGGVARVYAYGSLLLALRLGSGLPLFVTW